MTHGACDQSHFTPFPKGPVCQVARIDGYFIDLTTTAFKANDTVAAICSDNKIRIVTLAHAPDPEEGERLGETMLSGGKSPDGRHFRTLEDITIIGLVIGGDR